MTNTMQESAKYTPNRIRTDRELLDAIKSLPPEASMNQYHCGCEVIRESAGALYIRWCRLHKAAPELLEALKLYVALDARRHAGLKISASDWAECHQPASVAIQKATGG